MTNSDLLRRDVSLNPAIFRTEGPVVIDELNRWIGHKRYNIPKDLLDLWQWSGGGDLFDSTVELLIPVADTTRTGDDGRVPSVDASNMRYWEQGLPRRYLVFAESLEELAAVRQDDGKIVALDARRFRETKVFDSIDAWYRDAVRPRLAGHYGLETGHRRVIRLPSGRVVVLDGDTDEEIDEAIRNLEEVLTPEAREDLSRAVRTSRQSQPDA